MHWDYTASIKPAPFCWHNDQLGIDGVIIDRFGDATLFGQGEWDPPGGWRDFVLDKQTGKQIA